MKELNDKELDALIAEMLQRQMIKDVIQVEVMKELRHAKQRSKWNSMLRLVAFSFGLPLLLLVSAYGAYCAMKADNFSTPLVIVMSAFVGLVIYACDGLVKNFSYR